MSAQLITNTLAMSRILIFCKGWKRIVQFLAKYILTICFILCTNSKLPSTTKDNYRQKEGAVGF